jgi:hypothetical protein
MILLAQRGAANFVAQKEQRGAGFFYMLACLMDRTALALGSLNDGDSAFNLFVADPAQILPE